MPTSSVTVLVVATIYLNDFASINQLSLSDKIITTRGLFTIASSLLSDDMKIEIVHLHNALRRHFAKGSEGAFVANMGKLEWKLRLETAAEDTLDLQCSGTVIHQSRRLKSNLKTNSNGNVLSDIMFWYKEIKTLFYPAYGSCWPYERCRHAYTLLNAKHKQIGCAYRPNCLDGSGALLCLYDGGSFPFYETGEVCTKCTDDAPFCEDGLCVACDDMSQDCDCRKTCESPGIGLGTLNTTSCTCSCQYGMGPNCDEPCENPEQFVDYDICDDITKEMCAMPEYDDMMKEFCPTKCSCSPFPDALEER